MKTGLYKHYRGGLYHVLGVARHSEDGEVLVVYHHLDGTPGLWVRPLDMFQENVAYEGKTMPRFTYQGPFMEEPPTFLDPA